MERMDIHSKNEYLKVIRKQYCRAKTWEEKALLLDEYSGNTGQSSKYEVAKTPYQRFIASNQIPEEFVEKLRMTYFSLNPAELKRSIDAKPAELYQSYKEKKRAQHVDPHKKLVTRMIRPYMIQQCPVGLGT